MSPWNPPPPHPKNNPLVSCSWAAWLMMFHPPPLDVICWIMVTMRIAMTPLSIKCWYPGRIRRTPRSCWTICWRNMTRRWGRILEVRLEENQAAAAWERSHVNCVQTPLKWQEGLRSSGWHLLISGGESGECNVSTFVMLGWLGLLFEKPKRKLWVVVVVVVGVLWLHLQKFYEGAIKPSRTGNGRLGANLTQVWSWSSGEQREDAGKDIQLFLIMGALRLF